jgi:hypothetical protein
VGGKTQDIEVTYNLRVRCSFLRRAREDQASISFGTNQHFQFQHGNEIKILIALRAKADRQRAKEQEGKELLSPRSTTHNPKTNMVVAVVGREVEDAIGRTATPRIDAPGAAATYSIRRITTCYPGTAIDRRIGIVGVPTIRTPLMNITVHIK